MEFPEHARQYLIDVIKLNRPDLIQRLVYTPGVADEYNIPQDTWIDGVTIACLFNPLATEERQGESQIVVTAGRLTLLLEDEIAAHDRVRLLKRFGVDVQGQPVYEVMGAPIVGAASKTVDLQLVTIQ